MHMFVEHGTYITVSTFNDSMLELIVTFEYVCEYAYQLPLFGWQSWRGRSLIAVTGPINFLESFVPALFVDSLALRSLIEDGWLRLRVILHKLHVLKDCTQNTHIRNCM